MNRVSVLATCALFAATMMACGRSPEALLKKGNAALLETTKPQPDTATIDDGVKALREFTTRHMGHEHADSAYYLLGMIYGATQRNAEAGETFMTLVQNFPTSRLRPKSLILASQAYENVKKYGHAKQCMQTLMAEYPDHEFVKGGSAKWLFLNIGKEPEAWDQSFISDSSTARASTRPR
ncbi:MAG TPA: tetratricopeptide repeat protein [Candidatus Latescibacteria bacterium]|nr:tetratricopeptide repeat protein [Candidatus Latescibacterota bacterium]HQK22294.1 tetratricopeptide repeat protein [Candidatus Latescibacterota bacterium]HRU23974.1 tetratricopeptide repeat protein [Candidatus Latescibacterota bacterium]